MWFCKHKRKDADFSKFPLLLQPHMLPLGLTQNDITKFWISQIGDPLFKGSVTSNCKLRLFCLLCSLLYSVLCRDKLAFTVFPFPAPLPQLIKNASDSRY